MCDFYNIVQIQGRHGERGDPDVSEYVWHIGVGSYFPQRYGLSKLGDIDFEYSVILE